MIAITYKDSFFKKETEASLGIFLVGAIPKEVLDKGDDLGGGDYLK